MALFYGVLAAVGVTLLVCQFLLTFIGWGGGEQDSLGDGNQVDHVDSGAAHSHGSSWFFGVITFRSIVAFAAFFGLTGLALQSGSITPFWSLVGALSAGIAAMFVVHVLMSSLSKLRADGTFQIEHSVGQAGKVYVPIPGANKGVGKVLITVDSRAVELEATTPFEPLPTGTNVTVNRIINGELVEVVAANYSSKSLKDKYTGS